MDVRPIPMVVFPAAGGVGCDVGRLIRSQRPSLLNLPSFIYLRVLDSTNKIYSLASRDR